MGARKTHNRTKDSSFFSKDIEETIRKAKTHYKVYGEFYIEVILQNNEKTYYADYGSNGTVVKHFVNSASAEERAKWSNEIQ